MKFGKLLEVWKVIGSLESYCKFGIIELELLLKFGSYRQKAAGLAMWAFLFRATEKPSGLKKAIDTP